MVLQRAICWLTPRETNPNKIVVLAKRLLKAQAKRDGLANGRRAAVTIGISKERNDISVGSEFLLKGESDAAPAGNIRVLPLVAMPERNMVEPRPRLAVTRSDSEFYCSEQLAFFDFPERSLRKHGPRGLGLCRED